MRGKRVRSFRILAYQFDLNNYYICLSLHSLNIQSNLVYTGFKVKMDNSGSGISF